MKMKIKKLYYDAIIPSYAHETDAGMDLHAHVLDHDSCWLEPGERQLVSTGVAVEIPEGYVGLIRPRSGLATKKGVGQLSSGVVDSGYRGELFVGLVNHSDIAVFIDQGDRIAQMLIIPVAQVELEEVSELSESDRGEKGHGSTGA
jgi:dUTP diphosphatase